MAKEFTQSVYVGDNAMPSKGSMGQSEVTYGDQRQASYVDPGSEGSNAVKAQISNGGIGSQEQGEST